MKLMQGNCLELMPTLAPKSVDLILCDLPYGTTACKWDTIIPFEPLWAAYKRVCRNDAAVVLFGSEPFSSALRISNLTDFKYDWIWDKRKGGNIMNLKSQPYKVHEIISVFNRHNYYPIMEAQKERTGKTYSKGEANGIPNYGDTRIYKETYPKSILDISNANQTGKVHPTQKPVALMEYLIRTYTNPGDTVLDNCMGSGTTGVACLNTGRNFIGIEQDPNYFQIASNRIAEAQFQKALKDAERLCDARTA